MDVIEQIPFSYVCDNKVSVDPEKYKLFIAWTNDIIE